MFSKNDRTYWYDYSDINNLLTKKSQGQYEVIDSTGSDDLQTLQRVSEAFEVLNNPNSLDVVVIPINIGSSNQGIWQGSHWVGLVIKKIGATLKAFYTDSLSTPMENSFPILKDAQFCTLKQILINHGLDKTDIIESNAGLQLVQQNNGYDCGPWTVFNLDSLAKTNTLPQNVGNDEIVTQRNSLLPSDLFCPQEDEDAQKLRDEFKQNNIKKYTDSNEQGGKVEEEKLKPYDQSVLKHLDRYQNIKETNKIDDLTKLTSNLTISNGEPNPSDGYIRDSQFFPRCEYKARFMGTSVFKMSDPEYWGTYFRSTVQGGNCDRIAELKRNKKTYENKNINKPSYSAAKAGTIYSPWEYDEYKDIFYKEPKISKVIDENNNFLYDSLLKYKKSICTIVVKNFEEQTTENQNKLNVYFKNDYPCIMVQIKELNNTLTSEQSSIYKIFGAYFTAITNYVAKDSNIPIELVNRASFGHNIPSIAETSTSFRINIGLVPKIYATKVLVKSLKDFNNDFLVSLLNKTLKLGLTKKQVDSYNEKVEKYMKDKYKQAAKWSLKDNLFDVLCKTGDSKNQKVSYQIVRKKQYIDLLTDYVYLEMEKQSPDFAKPLRLVLEKLDFCYNKKTKKYQVALTINKDEYNCEYQGGATIIEFPKKENEDIKSDKEFWKIIENISSVFKTISIDNLSKAITDMNIKGLYSKLETANLEFIRNSSYQKAEDGYGSDSDCEVRIEKTTFYSKKITVGNAMRAINLAQFLSIYLTGSTKVDTTYMYYETGKSITQIKDIMQELDLMRCKSNSELVVKYIDLSHCAANGPDSTVELEKIKDKLLTEEKVIVFDYTSTETKKINEAVKLFIEKIPVLLLVSSGLKNEQLGADMNPYGTLRIVAKDSNVLNELYFGLRICLASEKEEWPKQLHNIRKAYKDAGAVVSNKAIYEKYCKNGDYYQPNEEDNIECSKRDFSFPDEFKKIFDLFFTGKYKEELHNLISIHKQNIADIVLWDVDRIEFLGSGEVRYVVDLANKEDYEDNFDQISNCYSENAEETKNVVYDIYKSENDYIVFDNRNFEEVNDTYLSIKEELSDDEIDDINIIDEIAARNEKAGCPEEFSISNIARSFGWELNTDDESSESYSHSDNASTLGDCDTYD